MKRIDILLCAAALIPLLTGCGGSGGTSHTGSLALMVTWPSTSRLIPTAANSIRATVTAGTTQLGTQLLPRPAGSQTTVTFTNLPAGPVTLTATSFPNADGSGVAQSVGLAPSTIVAGQTANVTVTMDSTIDHLTITPPNPSVNVGANLPLTVTAFNLQNAVVLTSPSKVSWTSGTTSIATIDNTGLAHGVAVGTSQITVTEAESGKSASTTVTVASGGGGQGSLSGKILFRSNGGFYSMNPDGSSVTHLPNTTDTDFEADVSTDGTKIVFWRQGSNHFIYSMNADGSNLVQLTNVSDNAPAWSPNGTKIAFERLFNGNGDIMAMNADGSSVVNLTNTPNAADFNPKWSPDGTKVLFVSNRTGTDCIFVMNADGSNLIQLTTGADKEQPDWSPDGSKIAFHTLGGVFKIWTMNADGSNQVQISAGEDSEADWSPDGTKLVFTTTRNAATEIYVMNADGSNQVRLTNNTIDDYSPKWR